ncbi:hypothetical protein BGZ51_007797 [Haplosporangium sp. Z 767]|nr:hypothetical protein BGZ51_007797 [Haplosporangium sp. Z 767]KAF9196104.1 hypothetical protein BGZ50_002084 [Haplosporangium sp. Z 11]
MKTLQLRVLHIECLIEPPFVLSILSKLRRPRLLGYETLELSKMRAARIASSSLQYIVPGCPYLAKLPVTCPPIPEAYKYLLDIAAYLKPLGTLIIGAPGLELIVDCQKQTV